MFKISSTINIHKIGSYIGELLILLMMIFPYKFQYFKLLLAVLLCLGLILKAYNNKSISVNLYVLLWIVLYVSMGFISILFGILSNNPAPNKYIPVYILWPIMFLLFILSSDESFFYRLLRCFRIALFIISLLGIIAFFYFNLNIMVEGEFMGFRPSFRPGFPLIAIFSGSIVSCIFLYPFYLSLFLLDRSTITFFDKLNLMIGLIFIIATSRRALFFNILLSIIVTFIVSLFTDKSLRKDYMKSFKKSFKTIVILIGFILIANIFYEFIDLKALYTFITDISGSSNIDSSLMSESYKARTDQFSSLISGWAESPLFGHGTGINASVVRSEIPGTYELTYVAMLFERGVVGAGIFLLQYILLNIWCMKLIFRNRENNKYFIAALVGFNMFIYANGTNPYLNAFDHLWILFFMLFILNIYSDKSNLRLINNLSL